MENTAKKWKNRMKVLAKKGFTLIELLVVIAIIALLLSIVMPGLRNAKAMARRMVCSSNLDQIGKAVFLYGMDNNDLLYVAPTPSGDPFWNTWYSWGGVTMDYDYDYLPSTWNSTINPYDRALNKYLPTDMKSPVYICPSDPSGDSVFWAPFGVDRSLREYTQAYFTSSGTSYNYNALLVLEDSNNGCGYRRQSQIKNSGSLILANEWPAFDILYNEARPDWWTDFPRWSFHDKSGRGTLPFEEEENGNTTCFMDGHVEYVDYIQGQYQGPGYNWVEN